jgi:phage replication O-like protein O
VGERLKPNFTQVPNVIFDELLRTLAPVAVKILFAICRYTYGWGRQSDRISLKQLSDMTGIKDRGNVYRAIKQLGNLVTVKPGDPSRNQASEYALNIKIPDSELLSLQSAHSKKRKPTLEHFELTDSLRKWCEENEFPQNLAEAELANFRDWHLAKGKRPKDIEAAFRNWLRKAREFRGVNNGNGDRAKSAEMKDLGNGFVEVDGRRMDKRLYERRYGQTA